MSQVQQLQAFLKERNVRYVNPDSSDYSEFRQQYILDTPSVPLGIARPQTAEDVARIVSYAVRENIEITVRSGGHELYGRCFAPGALAIDMRDIAFVEVDPTGTSATIGGGILSGSLATELAKKKLGAACGSIGSVGYVGWSTHGGEFLNWLLILMISVSSIKQVMGHLWEISASALIKFLGPRSLIMRGGLLRRMRACCGSFAEAEALWG